MTTFIGKYLNPGEVESILKTERDERRKRRLNQVRQQAREKASKIVLSVKKERDKHLQILSNHLEAEWLKNKQEQIEELGQLYGKNLQSVGEAHSNISKEIIANEAHILKVEEDKLQAAVRGAAALNEVKIQQVKEAENVMKQDSLRKAIKTAENERAKKISEGLLPLPPHPPTITQKDNSEETSGNTHVRTQVTPSSSKKKDPLTPNVLDLVKVIKIPANNEMNAHLAAELDKVKQAEAMETKIRKKIEQTKKEHIRFLKAKSQLELQQDYNKIMNKLEELSKIEESCSEPSLLLGLEKENNVLKQEQEAIIEELFSRLGLSLVDPAIKKDFATAWHIDGDPEIHSISTNIESARDESTSDATPVVHIIAHDSSTAIASISDSSPAAMTEESPSLSSSTTASSAIYANSYPIEGTTSTGESSSKISAYSGMTPVSARVESFPTSCSSATTNDETILAGHFQNSVLDSSKNIPVLPSLDSSDSKDSPGASQTLSTQYTPSLTEKRWNGSDIMKNSKKTPGESLELYSQAVSFTERSDSKSKRGDDMSGSKRQVTTEDVKDDAIRFNIEKPNIMDDKLRRLALTNLLASKKLGTLKPRAKILDSWPLTKFRDVEISQANGTEVGNLATTVLLDSSNSERQFPSLPTRLHMSKSHLPDSSKSVIKRENRTASGHVLNTSVLPTFRFTQPSISVLHPDSSSLPLSAAGFGVTPNALAPTRFRPTLVQTNLGKLAPIRDLSTIIEVDTPGSTQHTSWQNSSTLGISEELESGERFNPGFAMNEPGITDEPDLTLVSSECSTCSPNRSHVFDATIMTPSTNFFKTLDSKSIEDQIDSEMKRYKRSAFLSNTKRRDKSEKAEDIIRSTTFGPSFPSLQELSYFLRDLSSDESPPFDSYSTSVDSSGTKDFSTPTLSSGESHSCFSSELQRLPTLSTPNLEFLSGSNIPSFFMQNSYPSEIKSQVPSYSEDTSLSGLSGPHSMSALDSTSEFYTESLLSFILHERNANLSTLNPETSTGKSTSDLQASNESDAKLSGCPFSLSSQSESTGNSMFSFLRHELSASDNGCSGNGASPNLGHFS